MGTYGRKNVDDELSFHPFCWVEKCEWKEKGGFGPPKLCTLKLEEKMERNMCKDFFFLVFIFCC